MKNIKQYLFYLGGVMHPPYFKKYADFCPGKGSICNCPMWNCYYHFFKGRYSRWCMYWEVKYLVQGDNLHRK